MAKGELLIGVEGDASLKDAWEVYGVSMGESFLDTINTPLELKEFVTSESRLINGRVVIVDQEYIRKSHREFALSFRVEGDITLKTEQAKINDCRSKRNAFLELLYNGGIVLYVNEGDDSPYYHLIYKGKSATHSYDFHRTACTITARFEEPDPTNRTL